ncbi:response regulator [Deinococcus malanensis]|uniref:Response regulator n=1 Tax=Deinococcus malanensis TaxID=1706855 RepID=A0ABQ2F2U2_9DEIO|nr:response regulator [Deinococcus malanensis]GGK36072.1 response regulator [Deinococcus malanensis]
MPAPCHYLLIDDSPTDRLLAEEAFEHVGLDCSLTTVEGGRQALDHLRSATVQPDVILLDINMPGMSGFEVLEELKRDPVFRLIPVVMLTTSSARSDVTRAYSLHASSYLVKSLVLGEFLAQVEAFLKYWQANRVSDAQ